MSTVVFIVYSSQFFLIERWMLIQMLGTTYVRRGIFFFKMLLYYTILLLPAKHNRTSTELTPRKKLFELWKFTADVVSVFRRYNCYRPLLPFISAVLNTVFVQSQKWKKSFLEKAMSIFFAENKRWTNATATAAYVIG